MPFTDEDLDSILEETGEPIGITLAGVTVETIQGKFRKNFVSESPFQSQVGALHPVVTLKTSDLARVTNEHVFLIQGTEYKKDGKPEELPSGFTTVHLGVKK